MRIIICDDQEDFICQMSSLIKNEALNFPNINIEITTETKAKNILDLAATKRYDVAFIDIEMPELNGIELAKQLRKEQKIPFIVFVTNRDDLVFDALQFHPFSFIRKTHLKSEFADVFSDIIEAQARREMFMAVKHGNDYVKIKYSDITYFEKLRNNLIIHTLDGRFECRESISKIAQDLKMYGFIFCHQGYVVNSKFISKISGESFVLSSGESIPISRRRIKEAKSDFMREILGSYD